MTDAEEKLSEDGLRLSRHVQVFLHRQDPRSQMVCIADLASLFLAGVNPELRWQFRKDLFAMIDDLTEISHKRVCEAYGSDHPWKVERQ